MIQQFHSWLFIRRKQKHQFACTSVFIVALFTIAKTWKPPKCPSTDEWIQKMWYIYTMEYYSAMKKNEILPLATTWMDLEGIMFSETESDREGQTLCFFTYMWKWNHKTNEYNKTEIDLQIQKTSAYQWGGG